MPSKSWEEEATSRAATIISAALSQSKSELKEQIDTIDGEFQGRGMYGSSMWQHQRLELGRDELRKRSEIISSTWRRVIDVLADRRAKKLRKVAAKHAEETFKATAAEVGDWVIPKPRMQLQGLPSNSLDAKIEILQASLRSEILTPSSKPEKGWWQRQFEDLGSKVLVGGAMFLLGAALFRWREALFGWLSAYFAPP